MKPPQQSETSRAFSLVELLVVIGIIGILAALVLTTVSQGKNKAKGIQCVGNVRQLGQALQLFVADQHVYPLLLNPDYFKGQYSEHFSTWNAALENQISKNFPRPDWQNDPKSVWHCPSAKPPADLPSNEGYQDYGYNGYGMSSLREEKILGLGGRFHNSTNGRFEPPVAEGEITNPSEMMALGDGFTGHQGLVQDGRAGLWRNIDAQGNSESTKRSESRHQGRANVVFCDGHVESPTLKFLFEDTSDAALVRWNRDHLPHREKLPP